MKKIRNSIAIIFSTLLLVYFYKVTLTISAFIILLNSVIDLYTLIDAYKLKRFRTKNDGKYYLWYSSNKRLKFIIEKKLKPLIDEKYELIFNCKSQIESELKEVELRYLRDQSSCIKFPILFKIGRDKIHAVSFFREVNEFRHERINEEEFEVNVFLKLNKLKNE